MNNMDSKKETVYNSQEEMDSESSKPIKMDDGPNRIRCSTDAFVIDSNLFEEGQWWSPGPNESILIQVGELK